MIETGATASTKVVSDSSSPTLATIASAPFSVTPNAFVQSASSAYTARRYSESRSRIASSSGSH